MTETEGEHGKEMQLNEYAVCFRYRKKIMCGKHCLDNESTLSEILIYQALHSQSVNKLRKLYCLRPQGDKNITRHCARSLSD